MCLYRHYHYTACGHGEVMLMQYCENVQPISCESSSHGSSPEGPDRPAPTTPIGRGRAPGDALTGANLVVEAGAEGDDAASVQCSDLDDFLDLVDSAINSSTTSGSSRSTTYYSASLSESSRAHSTAAFSPPGMAGLPFFNGESFRHWMTGASAPKRQDDGSEPSKEGATAGDLSDANHCKHAQEGSWKEFGRPSGLRKDSFDLTKSNDVLQHMIESCRNPKPPNLSTDGRRIFSHDTTMPCGIHDNIDPDLYEFDGLATEIDRLKEEVLLMKEEAAKGEGHQYDMNHSIEELAHGLSDCIKKDPPKEDGQGQPEPGKSELVESEQAERISTSGWTPTMSLTAKLQRIHEQSKGTGRRNKREHKAELQSSPKSRDPPALSTAGMILATAPASYEDDQWRPGDADAIARRPAHVPTQRRSVRTQSKASDSAWDLFCAVPMPTSFTIDNEDRISSDNHHRRRCEGSDRSVIISSETTATESSSDATVVPSQGTSPDPGCKQAKASPRFAQPTKSFARRAGRDTRDASPSPSKTALEDPAANSAKGNDQAFVTEKRLAQRQPKRKALPGGWLGASNSNSEAQARSTRDASHGQAAAVAASSSPKKDRQNVSDPQAKENVESSQKRAQEPKPASPCKKASSYMAPTNATTQRAAATVRSGNAKRDSPVAKSAEVKPGATQNARREGSHVARVSHAPFGIERLITSSSNLDTSTQTAPATKASKLPLRRHNQSTSTPTKMRERKTMKFSIQNADEGDHNRMKPPKRPTPRHATLASLPEVDFESTIYPALSPGHAHIGQLSSPVLQVANTTQVRRTSNADMLQPILASLHAEGVLKKGSEATTARAPTDHILMEQTKAPRLQHNEQVSELAQQHAWPETALKDPSALLATQAPSVEATSRTPSLRATAAEFKPGWSSQVTEASTASRSHVNEEAQYDQLERMERAGSLDQYSSQEWACLPWGWRQTIKKMRLLRDRRDGVVRVLNRHGSIRCNRDNVSYTRARPDILQGNRLPLEHRTDAYSLSYANEKGALDAAQHFEAMQARAYHEGVRADYESVRAESTEPMGPPGHVVQTTYQPRANLLPTRNPQSNRGWTISPSNVNQAYGWDGGAGREISFTGHGPYAERSANAGGSYNFSGQMSTSPTAYPATVAGQRRLPEEQPSERSTVAPRSQQQWAALLVDRSVLRLEPQPCADEVTEHVCVHRRGGASGMCHDCDPSY